MYFKPNYAVVRHTMSKCGLGILIIALSSFSIAADSSSYGSALTKGKQLLEQVEFSDAAVVLDEAIKSLRAEQGGDTLDTVALLLPAATAHAAQKDDERSGTYFDAAIEVLKRPSSQDRVDLVVQAFATRKDAEFGWKDNKRLDQLVLIYDIAVEVIGDHDLRTANMATWLGSNLAVRGRQKEALPYLDQSYAILTELSFTDSDPIGLALVSLSAGNFQADRKNTANELLSIAMAIGASTDGPHPLRRVAPSYPNSCLSAAIQGEVDLVIGVDDDGHVQSIKVIETRTWRGKDKSDANRRSCYKGLERAATKAASQFRYIPKLENGLPVVSAGDETTMSFELED